MLKPSSTLPAPAIHAVTAASNTHRALVLRDAAAVSALMGYPWGQPLASGWQTLDLMAAPGTEGRALADVSALYLPGLLVVTEAAWAALPLRGVERLPMRLDDRALSLLNPLATVHRFQEKGACFMRMPDSGAVLFLEAADFAAQDLPAHAPIFWFHDGNSARYLLCGDGFVQSVADARLTGLSFTRLGHVIP